MTKPAEIPKATLRLIAGETVQVVSIEGDSERILGFKSTDLLSGILTFCDRVHPLDAHLLDRLARVAPDAEPVSTCFRFRHKDERIRCLACKSHVVHIDGRHVSEVELRLGADVWEAPSEDDLHFRALLESTADPVFFKDTNHVFVAASAAFRKAVAPLLGNRELLGLTDYDLLREQDADRCYAQEKEILATGMPRENLYELKPCGQMRSWIHADYHPLLTLSGEVAGFLAHATNLTERLEAEEQAENPDHALVGTYILDLNRGLFATSANLDSIFGIDQNYPRTLAGWEDLIYPADRVGILQYFQNVIAAPGRIFNKEYRIVRQNDGEVRWVHGIGRVDRDSTGIPIILRGSTQDITERKDTEAALRETKERLQLFVEYAPAALAMFDRHMRYLAVSRRWLSTYKIEQRELIGRSHYEVVPDLPERLRLVHQRGMAGEAILKDEDRFDRADGSSIWVRWEMRPWHQVDGSVGGIVLFLEDITEFKKAEQRLQLAASVFGHASEAIMVTNLDERIVEVNAAFTRITGYSREEAIGQSPKMLRSPDHSTEYFDDIWRTIHETGRWRGELWNRGKDGTLFAASTTITTVLDPAGEPQYYVSLFFDITPIKLQEQKLERAAHYDVLTGLPNRALAAERLDEAMVLCRQLRQVLAVIYIDLDDFKQVNDVHGRDVADSLLIAVSSRMKQVLRDSDSLARIGGDEFLVVLPSLSTPAAGITILERLLVAAREPYHFGDMAMQLSATAGVTFYPRPQDVDGDQLMRQAMQAMYEGKVTGKNSFCLFDPARDSSLRGRYEELGRIRRALQANEFVLYFQPKVNMATGALVGAEALIRWNHPERGMLYPVEFLPLVEDSDVAIELGEWVIDAALTQIEHWVDAGRALRVSVNIGARQLQQADFIQRLQALLDRHPCVSPSLLGLEVLESSALRDIKQVSEIIRACDRMGIRVAIDDFGTGYSSLTYLRQLPAGVLKIDQSFVRDMLDDADDLAILQGILSLATAFRRMPVAEGVETVGHGVMLLKLGCQVAQGFGIARPMRADALLPWHAQWRPDPSWAKVLPVSPEDWPLLIVDVELHAWALALQRYMTGVQDFPPEIDERNCRVGEWLHAEKHGPRAGNRLLSVLEVLHTEVHRIAQVAVELRQAGDHAVAHRAMQEAIALRREMCAQLSSLFLSAPALTRPAALAEVPESPATIQ